MRTAFFDALAATCSVRAAAEAAGVTQVAARTRKRDDPAFAQAWADAMALGAERLREEMFARVLEQVPADATESTPAALDTRTAMDLIKMRASEPHARQQRRRPDYATPAEVSAALLKRLDALARRLARS